MNSCQSHRSWDQLDEFTLLQLLKRGASAAECVRALPGRTPTAVAVKRAHLKKQFWTWGKKHREKRVQVLREWLGTYRPLHVLECFAGKAAATIEYALIAQDVLAAEMNGALFGRAKAKLRHFQNVKLVNLCAERLLLRLCAESHQEQFDWVDLDPFGSGGHLVPLAVRLMHAGHVALTLTEPQLFRFHSKDALFCKYPLPLNIFSRSTREQIGYLLGWIIFDSTRYTFWRDRKLVNRPKIVTPVRLETYGGLDGRIARVLFEVREAQSVRELRSHLYDGLSLFSNRDGLPYLDIAKVSKG